MVIKLDKKIKNNKQFKTNLKTTGNVVIVTSNHFGKKL